jgi:SacI restriction endonuclease
LAIQIINADATRLLEVAFARAEDDYRENKLPTLGADAVAQIERLFESDTQAYREALIGCAVARIVDDKIDVRLPATEHGENAFSGRSLADNVVTPFMQGKVIPVSRSPYLSSLRGGARFVDGGAPRIQRDRAGFAALVEAVDFLRQLSQADAQTYLSYLLQRFIVLRDSANIKLNSIANPTLTLLSALILGLLTVRSGGQFPAFLSVAMFQTISECHGLEWNVEFQGINVADAASGAVGDITIRKGASILLGVEVTERPISHHRVASTFEQKVSPNKLVDYLFVTTAQPEEDALAAAKKYMSVGHEMNFVPLHDWLRLNLATIGPRCRAIFQAKMLELLSSKGVAAGLKVAWNEQLDAAISAG